MIKTGVLKAHAFTLLNRGVVIKHNTADGYVEVTKKPKGIYETKIYTTGEKKPKVVNGNFPNLLKSMNRFNYFYITIENGNLDKLGVTILEEHTLPYVIGSGIATTAMTKKEDIAILSYLGDGISIKGGDIPNEES
jgi:hypothetical protein